VSVAGVIHDVSGFIADHPGGKALISSSVGKDATALFNGGVYEHSNAAHNLLSTMRVGILRGGQEVEVWKMDAVRLSKDTKGQAVGRSGEQITRVGAPTAAAVAA
jgi:stearoyl-CoA desaturase (delta-9 desaturase)